MAVAVGAGVAVGSGVGKGVGVGWTTGEDGTAWGVGVASVPGRGTAVKQPSRAANSIAVSGRQARHLHREEHGTEG